mmetsp:Transcript_23356/g.55271  ORF Transcript_23356/g.55271 Transcript_23356/m.55271 type:complete len:202 (+) Transcript_23356:94-699(+)
MCVISDCFAVRSKRKEPVGSMIAARRDPSRVRNLVPVGCLFGTPVDPTGRSVTRRPVPCDAGRRRLPIVGAVSLRFAARARRTPGAPPTRLASPRGPSSRTDPGPGRSRIPPAIRPGRRTASGWRIPRSPPPRLPRSPRPPLPGPRPRPVSRRRRAFPSASSGRRGPRRRRRRPPRPAPRGRCRPRPPSPASPSASRALLR